MRAIIEGDNLPVSQDATGRATLTYGANRSGMPMSCTGLGMPPTPGGVCRSGSSRPSAISGSAAP
jgi:hypothetical protein